MSWWSSPPIVAGRRRRVTHAYRSYTHNHPKWGDNSAKSYAGSYSAFCADNGSDSRTVYDNNLITYMQRQGVSLAGYTTATLSFKYWLNTESGFDKFTVNIRDQNGTWHAPEFTDSGNDSSLGWQSKTLNLNAYAGQTGLYIQFLLKVTAPQSAPLQAVYGWTK